MSIMSNRVHPAVAASHPAMTPQGAGAAPLVAPAIDFGHLARQSLGDQALEVELMQLFDRQAARIAAELGMPDLSKMDPKQLEALKKQAEAAGFGGGLPKGLPGGLPGLPGGGLGGLPGLPGLPKGPKR